MKISSTMFRERMKVKNLIKLSLGCIFHKTLFVFIFISSPASLLPTPNSTSATLKVTPIVTSFRSIMEHLNSLKFPEALSDSQLTSRSTYPTYQPHKLTYPYIHHTIKNTILPTPALEMGNQNLSDSTGKYYTFPEPFSSPVYTDLAYRQTAPEIGSDYNTAATINGINGLNYSPLAQLTSTIPMTSSFGQQNYPVMSRPYTLYGYSGSDFGYGGLNHESGHSPGHYQHHTPPVQHGGSNHHTVQYIPIPVAVNHDKSGNNHHKHDLTTLLAAIALAAGLPLLLGALLLPLGVLFLLNLATLIAVLATGLGGAGNGTRIENPTLNRGRRSLTDHYTVGYDDQFMTIFQDIIFNFIFEIIQKAL